MKECTFSPNLNTQGHKKHVSEIKMYDRINIWNEKKKSKVESIKTQLEEKKYEECKFHPEIVRI